MKIAIAGATGFVGSRLVEKLNSEGHQVLVLTRNPQQAQRTFPDSAYSNVQIKGYNPTESGDWQQALVGCDGVVNLAGVPIADERWTAERKQAILQSRTLTTEKIVEGIAQANPRPSVLVSASAVGFYGTSEAETFVETSNAGEGFLADVCQAWEAKAEQVKAVGTRLAILRLGIVLDQDGGALAKMLTPFRLFAGGPLGSGEQWFSWIHRDDLVDLIIFCLQHPEVEGTLNATAPNPVRMSQLCNTLGQVMNRPSWLPVPGFALEALLGDAAQLVLEGQRVLPERTLAYNFEYKYPKVDQALREILD
ncbi:MAG: TIGR01777 family oxidoreductase [Microcoleaceae cyanobacterium]